MKKLKQRRKSSILHFQKILKRYVVNSSYEFFESFDYHNFSSRGKGSVIDETKGYRKSLNFPKQYIVLAQPGDDGIYFKTPTKDNPSSSVIWCDHEDFLNICAGRPFTANPDIFPSFTDFFEFLLKREEEDRALESSLLSFSRTWRDKFF